MLWQYFQFPKRRSGQLSYEKPSRPENHRHWLVDYCCMHIYCIYDLVSSLSLFRLCEPASSNKPSFVNHQDDERPHPGQHVRLKVAVRTLVISSLRHSKAALFLVQEPALSPSPCVQVLRAWPSVRHLHCIYALQSRRRNVVELTCRPWLKPA